MMDGDSSESTVENGVAGVGRDESELEWLVRGCWSQSQSHSDSATSVIATRQSTLTCQWNAALGSSLVYFCCRLL